MGSSRIRYAGAAQSIVARIGMQLRKKERGATFCLIRPFALVLSIIIDNINQLSSK